MKNIFFVITMLFLVGCAQTSVPMMEDQDQLNDMDDAMGEKKGAYKDISVAEAKMLIDDNPDLIIIDVSPYFDNGHIPGAVNYPLGSGAFDSAMVTFDPAADYLIYCHGDSPAIQAAQKLVDAGFMNVYRLRGNYGAWVDAGYPVE